MKAIIALLFTLLVGTYAADSCTYTATLSGSITPASNQIFVQSLEPAYDNFNVNWVESFTGDVSVLIQFYSSSASDYQSFTYSMANNNGVYVSFQKTSDAGQTTAKGGSTSGSQGQVSSTSTSSSGGRSNSSTTTTTISSTSTTGSHPSAGSSLTPSGVTLLCAFALAFAFPNKRISFAFLLLAGVILISSSNLALAQCSSSATFINITIAVPSSINQACISGQCYSYSNYGSVGATGYISLFGYRFSQLGGLAATCTAPKTYTMPAGWAVTNATTIPLIAIDVYDFNWNSYLMGTSDQNSYIAGKYDVYGEDNAYTINADGTYTISTCGPTSIVITQPYPLPDPARDIVAPPRVAPANILTFNGFDYAVADNVSPTETTTSCPVLIGVFLDGTDGWSIAPPNSNASVIAVSGTQTTFGTQCLILSDGSSLTNTGAPCSPFTVVTPPTLSYLDGTIYSQPTCSRFLLWRPSTLPSTWTVTATITVGTTDVYSTAYGISGTFALMTGEVTGSTTAAACQGNYMTVPSGWRLTTYAELYAFANTTQNHWQWATTYCYATIGGSYSLVTNQACSAVSMLTIGKTEFYWPPTCGQILLIQSA